jgi:GTP 3',8-cyclase
MPAEVFGADYPFLHQGELLSIDSMVRVVQAASQLGVKKLRLTGGEPLLRRNLPELVARLHQEGGVPDMAMTTNGLLLRRALPALKNAGLGRINLSLDAVDPQVFLTMSGGRGAVQDVLGALDACLQAGMPVKLNMVVKRGWNDREIESLLSLGLQRRVEVRFIEYMDVGTRNGWQRTEVYAEREILARIRQSFGTVEAVPSEPHAVARKYRLSDQGGAAFGIIASITRPFCGGCVRARVSADGKLFTCLFSDHGYDLRPHLEDTQALVMAMGDVWRGRKDRYSELREQLADHPHQRVEMSYIGG